VKAGDAKQLKRWSGRPGSNRRRPAWECGWRLKIKNIVSTEVNSGLLDSATSEASYADRSLMEWKWSGTFFANIAWEIMISGLADV
jgi:hypothetical protein